MIFQYKSFKALSKFFSALFLFVCLAFSVGDVAAQISSQSTENLIAIPALSQRVVDLTNTLTQSQAKSLDEKLATFESLKGSQVVVLIVDTTLPEDIAQYSIRVVDKWKIGRTKVDDGVLILIAKKDRRIRIEVGYGLEGILNDAISRRIISETISPLFKQGLYFEGIEAGIDRIIALVNEEPLPKKQSQELPIDQNGILIIAFILALFVGGILRNIFGSGLAGMLTGLITGSLAWFLCQLIGISILAAIVGFIATFVGNVGGPSVWGGGSSFPGNRGGGGGSFNGGGGSFGGGGASGDW